MAKYKAIARGFDGLIREVGDEFEYEGKPGSWMQLIEEPKPAKEAKPEKAKPVKAKK